MTPEMSSSGRFTPPNDRPPLSQALTRRRLISSVVRPSAYYVSASHEHARRDGIVRG